MCLYSRGVLVCGNAFPGAGDAPHNHHLCVPPSAGRHGDHHEGEDQRQGGHDVQRRDAEDYQEQHWHKVHQEMVSCECRVCVVQCLLRSAMACDMALTAVQTVTIEEGGKREIDIKRYAKVEKVCKFFTHL